MIEQNGVSWNFAPLQNSRTNSYIGILWIMSQIGLHWIKYHIDSSQHKNGWRSQFYVQWFISQIGTFASFIWHKSWTGVLQSSKLSLFDWFHIEMERSLCYFNLLLVVRARSQVHTPQLLFALVYLHISWVPHNRPN